MSHEGWFKRLKESCERLKTKGCDGKADGCLGIGYCHRVFEDAKRVTRRRK